MNEIEIDGYFKGKRRWSKDKTTLKLVEVTQQLLNFTKLRGLLQFLPQPSIFVHRYICHIGDILQLCCQTCQTLPWKPLAHLDAVFQPFWKSKQFFNHSAMKRNAWEVIMQLWTQKQSFRVSDVDVLRNWYKLTLLTGSFCFIKCIRCIRYLWWECSEELTQIIESLDRIF